MTVTERRKDSACLVVFVSSWSLHHLNRRSPPNPRASVSPVKRRQESAAHVPCSARVMWHSNGSESGSQPLGEMHLKKKSTHKRAAFSVSAWRCPR